MSANLFGERYFGKVTAWHKLGTVFGDETPTMSEAVERGGLNYQVNLEPLYVKVQPRLADGLFDTNRRRAVQLNIPDRFAIVREPTPDDPEYRSFGLVSHKYEVLQNEDIARSMDQLIDDWPVETAGALGKGETVFFTLRVNGPTDIRGDVIEEYFLISDKKTGNSALKVAFVPLRVVCNNTLTAALGSAKVLSFMSHTEGVGDRLETRIKVLQQLNAMREQTKDNFYRLADAIFTDEQIDSVFEAAYPAPSKPQSVALLEDYEDAEDDDIALLGSLFGKATKDKNRWIYYRDRAVTMRKDAKEELVRINDEELVELPHLQNSGWAVWQAITSREDHREGPESLYESALFGDRAKTKIRAFGAALKAIK